MPSWMVIPEQVDRAVKTPRPSQPARLTRYAEAALDNMAKRIVGAGAGEQEVTLNREAFAIGQLAGGGVIPPSLALDSIVWAARQIPSFDRQRPWRPADVERKVKSAFADGLREPRGMPNG
jgi:hypothetical protein